MTTSIYDGNMVNSRQAQEVGTAGEGSPTPVMVLESELIELGESDEVVDLTSEPLEPAVIDLTHHDSVVITEERRRPRRNARSRQGQTGSWVVSSDKKRLMRDRDVYVTNSAHHNALEKATLSCTLPGYIRCRICMDGYSEIESSRRHIYSTECGHIFCTWCLFTSLKYSKNCPVCLKTLGGYQYHRIYIWCVLCCSGQTNPLAGFFHILVQKPRGCWHPMFQTQKARFEKLLFGVYKKLFYFSQTVRLLFDSFGFMMQGGTFVVTVSQRLMVVLKAIFSFS